ncbi:MAG: transporter substrate-binding domain-containing protein [Pseudomonadota bacterium]
MRTLACAMIGALCAAVTAPAQAQDLRIATEGYYAPFNYFDETGALVGFDVDIANALCDEIGAECEIVQNDWDALIPGLNEGAYDVIVASMSITAERETLVAFTLPYYSNMLAFVGPRGTNPATSPEALAGKTVGTQVGTISADHLAATYGDGVEAVFFENQEEAMEALAGGDIDLVLGDNLQLYAWLQTEGGADHEIVGEFIDIDDRIGIAVRQTDPELLDRLNGALIAIIENGVYQEINARYFPFSIYF